MGRIKDRVKEDSRGGIAPAMYLHLAFGAL